MPALRFQTCRLLSGNVWKRELTIIQRRILERLRTKKRSMKRRQDSRPNLNSYIQSQTTRKLSLFHGNLPITEMHRRRQGQKESQRKLAESIFSFVLKWLFGALAILLISKLEGVDVEGLIQPWIANWDHRPRSPWQPLHLTIPQPAPPQAEPVLLPPPPPPPPVIPQLPEPLILDQTRKAFLYDRYTGLSVGRIDGGNLDLMVRLIDVQLRIEKHVEAALVHDGFHPDSIMHQYTNIRGALHSPSGSLLTLRTYHTYESQILQRGTRQSLPYRRLLRLIENNSIILYRG